MNFSHQQKDKTSILDNTDLTYEIIKKKYRNLLILKDFGYCEPDYFSCSCSGEKNYFQLENYNDKSHNFGCGEIDEIAEFSLGETVLDLGCGCGNDCILAAKKVGKSGKVIGVDILPEMISRAKEEAESKILKNIDFIEASIEKVPLENSIIDIVISNCVINLSPNKYAVYSEIARLLKPLGRVAISDIITLAPLPLEHKNNKNMLCACFSGAMLLEELEQTLKELGFVDIVIKFNRLNTNLDFAQSLRRAYITAILQE